MIELTRAAFMNWLVNRSAQNAHGVVGFTKSRESCPIAQYLMCNGGDDVSVCGRSYVYTFYEEDAPKIDPFPVFLDDADPVELTFPVRKMLRKEFHLPGWARKFVYDVDRLSNTKSRGVTAYEAIKLLCFGGMRHGSASLGGYECMAEFHKVLSMVRHRAMELREAAMDRVAEMLTAPDPDAPQEPLPFIPPEPAPAAPKPEPDEYKEAA